MNTLFKATRRLIRLGADYPRDADGFSAPTGWWEENAEQWSAADVLADASLAIIGEPGVGKSEMLGQIAPLVAGAAWMQMDEYSDPEALTTALRSAMDSAASGPHSTVVIDGLDESPLPPSSCCADWSPR